MNLAGKQHVLRHLVIALRLLGKLGEVDILVARRHGFRTFGKGSHRQSHC